MDQSQRGGTAPPVLERGRLGNLTKLAAGGQGTTYTAPGVHLSFAPDVVFKEYKAHLLDGLDVAQLAAMPQFLMNLSGADALTLISICAWPCATVSDGTRTVGFVMPLIPDRFRIDVTTVRGTSRRTAEFQHLLNGPEYLRQRGITVSDGDRYRLLGALASALAFLHSLGVAVGDISPKNMMFSLHPEPAVYFIDADAMRVRGAGVSAQAESPTWEVPAGEELGTALSDRYKLGLLALRMLSGDHDAKDARSLPAGTPPEIAGLVHRALTAPAPSRPAPSDWVPRANAAAAAADLTPTVPTAAPTRVVRARPPRPAIPSPAARPPRPVTHHPAVARTPTSASASNATVIAIVLASVFVLVLLMVGVKIANTDHDSTDSAATTSRSSATTTTYTYPTTTTTTTPPRTSEAAPSGTTACPSGNYSVNSVTTCGFASNVFIAMTRSELPMLYTGIVSPSRQDRTFDMLCRYASSTSRLVVCTGGDNATVYIP